MKDALRYGKMSRKLALISCIPTLIFSAFSHPVAAEDQGMCFMVTSSGQTLSLNKLCGMVILPTRKIAQLPIPMNPVESNQEILPPPVKTVYKIPQHHISRIPIKRRIGATPVIEVRFNNRQTFEMILDTGANNTLITRGMAKKLKIKPTGIMEAEVADGSEIKLLTGRVKTMNVNGVIARNLKVAIAPKADIGLLGHDFFGKYDIRLFANEVEFQRR
jgi:predicted aspartyl protease